MNRSVTNDRQQEETTGDRAFRTPLRTISTVSPQWTALPHNGDYENCQPPPPPSKGQLELRLTPPPFTSPCVQATKPHWDENDDPTPMKRRRTSPPHTGPAPANNLSAKKRPDTPRKSPSKTSPIWYERLVPRRGNDVNWTREQFHAYLWDRFGAGETKTQSSPPANHPQQ